MRAAFEKCIASGTNIATFPFPGKWHQHFPIFLCFDRFFSLPTAVGNSRHSPPKYGNDASSDPKPLRSVLSSSKRGQTLRALHFLTRLKHCGARGTGFGGSNKCFPFWKQLETLDLVANLDNVFPFPTDCSDHERMRCALSSETSIAGKLSIFSSAVQFDPNPSVHCPAHPKFVRE